MGSSLDKLKIEPCSECPIPPHFVCNVLPSDEPNTTKIGVECRECGDKWTEIIDE